MNERPENRTTALNNPADWVDQYGDSLFRFALKRIGDRHAAEDLVQETFIAALKTDGFLGQSDRGTWLTGILKHKIVDYYRRRGRERLVASSQDENSNDQLFDDKGWWKVKPDDWPVDKSDSLETAEFWATFRRCLDDLPEQLRTVFSLREMDSHTTEEVCGLLNITAGNLGVIVYRARIGIRRCLEVHWFGNEKSEG